MDPAADRELITSCLDDLRRGDRAAVDRLLPLVYQDLRALARKVFGETPGARTLQPTALVHECYLRLVGGDPEGWADRRHFFNVAALAMRQLLRNYARDRRAQKRGGDRERVALEGGAELGADGGELELVTLEDALTRLTELDERQGRIVELRFLAGLSVAETAEVLGVSERTVYLDWQMARAWLSRELD